MKEFFTSQEAAVLFKQHTGFEFHSTVPGQLLAKRGVKKRDGKSKPAQYAVAHWDQLWKDMVERAVDLCKWQAALEPPKRTSVPRFPTRDSVARAPKVGATFHSVRFIDVKWADREEAKAAGAKWDWKEKMWYIPADMDVDRFRWPEIVGLGSASVDRPEAEGRVDKKYAIYVKQSLGYKLDGLLRDLDDRLVHLLAKDD